MDRFNDSETPQVEHEVEEKAAPQASPVARIQRRLGNSYLLQLRAAQKRSSAPVQLDAFDDVKAEQAARQEARRESALEQQAEQASLAVPSGGEALPAQVQAIAEKQHGVKMDDVRIVHGADAATEPIQAKAFTTQEGSTPKVVMSSMDMQSQDAQFTLMHELSHVAQQKKGVTGGLDGLGGDEAQREHLENHAVAHAAEMLSDPGHKH
jgi:hypothetical protein